MDWIEFTIKTQSESAEVIAERLAQLGASGIATEDPSEFRRILESDDDTAHVDPSFVEDLLDYTKIRTYFAFIDETVAYNDLGAVGAFSDVDTESLYAEGSFPKDRIGIEGFLKILEAEITNIAQFLDVSPQEVSYELVDELSWRDKWKENYHPMRLSKHLFVVPTWEEFRNPPGTAIIRLDPGSAFGTGSHETTQMCAELLDRYMSPAAKVLDLGTGSGILAIAAAKLGARAVKAIDISAHSVEVARGNILQNDVQDIVTCDVGELKHETTTYDLIVANLIAEVLINIAEDFEARLNDLALLVCSGIIDTKVDLVINKYESLGFHVFAQEEKNDWHAIIFSK